jgi:hypothetical protein
MNSTMKIAFICGSLEPGRDGVGDYTCRLAGELNRGGHQVAIVAFHDQFVATVQNEIRTVSSFHVPVLRLPATMPAKERLTAAEKALLSFCPDWVSLQFVNFGFHRYGLPFELFRLKRFTEKSKLHIMFHELWCGMSPTAGVKERILGRLQKGFTKRLLSTLKPARVFTNVVPYCDHLKQFKTTPVLAPIFGNIDLLDHGTEEEWNQIAQACNFNPKLNGQDWLILGFFGAVYSCEGFESLVRHAAQAAATLGKSFGILRIGKPNERLQDVLKILQNVHYWETGILSPGMVNRFMSYVDCGVITTPANKLDKSGSAIAWLERGIPILVPAGDETYQKQEMLRQGVVQVLNVSDVIITLQIKKDSIKQDQRLQENAQLYAALS